MGNKTAARRVQLPPSEQTVSQLFSSSDSLRQLPRWLVHPVVAHGRYRAQTDVVPNKTTARRDNITRTNNLTRRDAVRRLLTCTAADRHHELMTAVWWLSFRNGNDNTTRDYPPIAAISGPPREDIGP